MKIAEKILIILIILLLPYLLLSALTGTGVVLVVVDEGEVK